MDDVLSLSFCSPLSKHLPPELGLLSGTRCLFQLKFAHVDLFREHGELKHVHLVEGLGSLPFFPQDDHLFGGHFESGGGFSHLSVLEDGGFGRNTSACLSFSLDPLSFLFGHLQMTLLLDILLLDGPSLGGIHGADVDFHLVSRDLSENVGLLLG